MKSPTPTIDESPVKNSQSPREVPQVCALCASPLVPGKALCRVCYSPCLVEADASDHRAWLPVELTDVPGHGRQPTRMIEAPDADGDARGSSSVELAAIAGGPTETEVQTVPAIAPREISAAVNTDNNAENQAASVAERDAVSPADDDALAVPEIVGDVDADLVAALHADANAAPSAMKTMVAKAYHTLHLPSITGGMGLPEPHELPVLPEMPVAPMRPSWRERRRAAKLDLSPEEFGIQCAFARLLGAADVYSLDAPHRAAVRIQSAARVGVQLPEEKKRAIIRETFVEVSVEKYREIERQQVASIDAQSRGAWLGIAAVVHLIVLLGVWSLVVLAPVEAPKSAPMAIGTITDIPKPPAMSRIPIPPAPIEAPPLPEDFDLKEPDIIEPDEISREPEFAGHNFMPMPSEPRPEPPAPNPHRIPSGSIGLSGALTGSPSATSAPAIPGGGLATRRRGQGREQALRKHGGNAATEAAVQLGLKWLSEQQEADGSWVPPRDESPAAHSYFRGGYTGLALLCFLGAGHSPSAGTYRATVGKGVNWMLDNQRSSGAFGEFNSGIMYNHTVCLLALCETYALTGDTKYRRPIERGLQYLYDAQQRSGGWDYTPTKHANRTDTSITGWGVMAMKSARLAGIDVDREAWDAAHRVVVDFTEPNGEVYYSKMGNIHAMRKGLGMIAVGLLCRLYLGEGPGHETESTTIHGPDLERSLAWLDNNLPDWDALRARESDMNLMRKSDLPSDDEFFHTVYYWYYGTLSMFLYTGGTGDRWARWNEAMQKAVLENQHTDEGDDLRGSWDAVHPFWGVYSGRLYATCLNILNLEIYYRYSPLYGGDAQAVPGKLVSRRDRPAAGNGTTGGTDPVTGQPVRPRRPDPREGTVDNAIKLLDDQTVPNGDQKKAIDRLKAANTPEAIAAIVAAMKNPAADEYVRWEAVRALGDLQARQCYADMLAAARLAFNESLRPAIFENLGRLGHPAAFDELVRELRTSRDERLREAAERGLENLTGRNLGSNAASWEAWRRSNPDALK